MATVRITSNIRFYVRGRIEAVYNELIENKRKELLDLNIGEICYQHYIKAEYRELAQQLNSDPEGEWFYTLDRVPIEMFYTADDDLFPKRVVFFIPFKEPVWLPIRFRKYDALFQLTETMAPYEQAKEIFLKIDHLIAERGLLIRDIVNGVLTKCTTLRQVLKLWPNALDFMPDYVKEQHAAKPQKRQRTVKQLSINNSDFNASLMKASTIIVGG